ncbi:MAG: peptidase S10 [Maribacter sp.]|nr:peptidase S10 [Maribacter sp.]
MKKLILAFFLVSISTISQEPKKEEVELRPIPKPASFVTEHQGFFGGVTIKYRATAKETYLTNEAGDSVASIWSVAYTQNPLGSSSKRPVAFIFNGGPGSASIWLHFGLLGPQIVKVDSEAKKDDGAAPFELITNQYGLLDLIDLVFIDPVGTGYSRVIGKGKETDYWGLKEDARSVAKFMRQWITENDRWNSPKYIIGESFGTTRAAAVGAELEDEGQTMSLNGMVLISQALDYDGSTSVRDNITSFITYLPSMAAAAWYHKKAGEGKPLEVFLQECREFTYTVYTPALYKGNLLSNEEKSALAEKLSYFIGLDKAYILKSDLRVLVPRFQKKLLEDTGLAIGRLDGRFMGDEADKVSENPHLGDPASYQVDAAYTASLNHYFAAELKVKMDRPYLVSNEKIGEKWRWRTAPENTYWEPSPPNVARSLGETMRRNTAMKVLVASGYFDLICPFFDAEYTFNRNGIVKERIEMRYYEAGHMMYLHQPDLIKLTSDIRKFILEE